MGTIQNENKSNHIKGILDDCEYIASVLKSRQLRHSQLTPDGILQTLGVKKKHQVTNDSKEFPAKKRSEQKPLSMKDAKYAARSVSIKFTSDGKVSFTLDDIINAMNDVSKQGIAKGNGEAVRYKNFSHDLKVVLMLIKNKSERSKLIDGIISNIERSIEIALDDDRKVDYEIPNQVQDIIEKHFDNGTCATEKDMFRLEDFKDFSLDLAKIGKCITDGSKKLGSKDESKDEKVLMFNYSQKKCFFLLMRINYITNEIAKCFQGLYVIDRHYEGRITDSRTLAKFVDQMIANGIPAKYIAFNIYAVCSASMKGKGSSEHPFWGQTRVVLFPLASPNTVIKVAMSETGKQSNEKEYRYWNKVKDTEYGRYFAPIHNVYGEYTVVVMSKAEFSKEAFNRAGTTESDAIEKLREVSEEAKKAGLPQVRDIRENNVGVIGKQIACIDYAVSP